MIQFGLPLDWPANEQERDFIVSEANRIAVRHLNHVGVWPVMSTLLTGPRKSGRSFLGRIFAAKTGGTLIDHADETDEETLFHAWNRAQGERRPLLFIANSAPPEWEITLPDLRSRMGATPHIRIEEPDDALMPALIERLIGIRGLGTTPEVLAYLARRIERTYVAINRLVDAIDTIATARRSRVNLTVARDALAELGVIDD